MVKFVTASCRFFVIDLFPKAMAKFRKSLHFDEMSTSSSSESDHEEKWASESHDLSPPAPKKQRRRQSKPPAKLREYDTKGSNIDNIPQELCKCI